MSRKAATVEDDVVEVVQEDELASIIAEFRKRSEAEDVREPVE
jgi:hypothetical protein